MVILKTNRYVYLQSICFTFWYIKQNHYGEESIVSWKIFKYLLPLLNNYRSIVFLAVGEPAFVDSQ